MALFPNLRYSKASKHSWKIVAAYPPGPRPSPIQVYFSQDSQLESHFIFDLLGRGEASIKTQNIQNILPWKLRWNPKKSTIVYFQGSIWFGGFFPGTIWITWFLLDHLQIHVIAHLPGPVFWPLAMVTTLPPAAGTGGPTGSADSSDASSLELEELEEALPPSPALPKINIAPEKKPS